MSQIEYTDRDGQTRVGYPVVILADRTSVSSEAGSKTEFVDDDGRKIHATPLIVVEDYRDNVGGGGGGASVVDNLDGSQTNAAPSVRAVKEGIEQALAEIPAPDSRQAPFTVDLPTGAGVGVTVGEKKAAAYPPVAGAVRGIVAILPTASTAGPVTLDVKVGGLSILSGPLQIDATESSSRTASVVPTLIADAFMSEEEMSFDVLGAGTGAAGVMVRLYCEDCSGGAAAPEITAKGTVAGTPVSGQQLTYTMAEVSGATGTVNRTRQWYRDKSPIAGAVASIYQQTISDIHHQVYCVETITKAGVGTVKVRSNALYVIDKPAVITPPVITGTPFLGQTLGVNLGTYTDGGVVTALSWERSSSAIGDTDNLHQVLAPDVGAPLVIAVTVTNAAGSNTFRSAAVVPAGPVHGDDDLTPLSADAFVTVAKPIEGGNTYVEPTYGLTIARATDYTVDAIGSQHIRHASARQPVFNADGTYYLARSSDGFWILYDSATYAPIRRLTIDARAEPIWHPTDPAILWHTAAYGSLTWYARNVTTDMAVVLVDFTGRLGALAGAARVHLKGGCPSANGRYWTFCVDSAVMVHVGILTWDRQTDTILGTLTAAAHGGGSPEWVSTGPSGTHAVVAWTGANGTRSYNMALSASTAIATSAPVGDLCFGATSQDLFVYFDQVAHSIKIADCSTGTTSTLMSLTWGAGSAQEITSVSISGKAFDRPGWGFFSAYGERYIDESYGGSLSTVRAPWRKVFVAKLSAGGAAKNVAHTQITRDYGGFVGASDAVPSRNGRRCIWASNFGAGGGVDLYATQLPDVLLPGAPEAPAFTSDPVITSVSGIYEVGQVFQMSPGTFTGEPAPTISYQWLDDGVNDGTDADTFTADSAGVVGGIVTLTNTQGSVSRSAAGVTVVAPNVPFSTFVRSAKDLGQSNFASAATTPFAVAAGQMIVVDIAFEDSPAGRVPTIADTAGNTYVALPVVVCPDNECRTQVFYCLSSVASANNVVTVTATGVAVPTTQVRATVYSPGTGRHFVYDKESHLGFGFSDGPKSTPTFNTPGQGVLHAAFSNNYNGTTGWPVAAVDGWTYIENDARPLISQYLITDSAQTGAKATIPLAPSDYNRGALQAVSFLTVPN